MAMFFYIGVANPKYNQKHIQFALEEWNEQLFFEKLQDKLKKENYLVRIIEYIDQANNIRIPKIFRPELMLFLLVKLEWRELKFKFPQIDIPLENQSEQLIDISYSYDLNFYQKNVHKLKNQLNKYKDETLLENAIYKFLVENNYKNFFYEDGKFFAEFGNKSKQIYNDDLEYLIKLYRERGNNS